MNLKISISLLLIFIASLSKAQDASKKIDLKIGFAMYKSISAVSSRDYSPNLNVDIERSISDFLKTGVYAGASVFKNRNEIINWEGYSLAIYYGASFTVDLLRIVVKDKDLKPGLYVLAKMGGRFISAPEDYFYKGNDFIWTSGFGVSYRFNKRFGAFFESTYGNNIFDMRDYYAKKYNYTIHYTIKYKIDYRYGIVLKF